MSETTKKPTQQEEPAPDPNWPRNVDTRLKRLEKATMEVTVELGRTRLPLQEILNIEPGSIVETERLAGMPLDIFVNGTLFGRGETVVVKNNLAVRISDLIRPENR
ncbi:MAG: FliM/FliN family flagellar motor switch protein [bacterium]|nr:FliM/FliN family flagellar motor switch protein [bacterium]